MAVNFLFSRDLPLLPPLSCLLLWWDLLKVSRKILGSVRGQGLVHDRAKELLGSFAQLNGPRGRPARGNVAFLDVSVLTGTLSLGFSPTQML